MFFADLFGFQGHIWARGALYTGSVYACGRLPTPTGAFPFITRIRNLCFPAFLVPINLLLPHDNLGGAVELNKSRLVNRCKCSFPPHPSPIHGAPWPRRHIF